MGDPFLGAVAIDNVSCFYVKSSIYFLIVA
jgi:hypothetical protein